MGNENGPKKRKLSSAFAEASGISSRQPNSIPPSHATGAKIPEATQPKNTTHKDNHTSTDYTVVRPGLLPPIDMKYVRTEDITRHENEEGELRHTSVTRVPRRRLIDTLAAQKVDSDSESEAAPSPETTSEDGSTVQGVAESTYASPSPHVRHSHVRTPDRRPLLSKGRKIKLTYSQSRSFLGAGSQSTSESSSLHGNATKGISPTDESVMFPVKTSPPPVDYDFEDDPSQERLGIQSVHELRRAGANNRFSDEMDDLLSRIGKPTATPSTMRRNALCELANKLQRKDFSNQFRDHASRDKIVKSIGSETDIISGFALAASLVIFLSSSPAPHLLRQMATDRVGNLLCLLFQPNEDIESLILDKSMNLTRNTKSSLKAVKSQLLQMAIWHGQKPSTLTPRTLALQLLHILSRDADPSCLEDISRDINKDISRISLTYSAADSHGDIDYALIIYALEAQSNLMPLEGNEYAPAIAGFLRQSLHNWPSRRGSLDKATLKLAINTGNTKSGAAIFDEPSLLSSLAASISTGFALVQAAVEKDAFENELYDELLLILGIIINVLEHCPDARASMDGGSLDALTGLWVNSSSIVNDVSESGNAAGHSKLTE